MTWNGNTLSTPWLLRAPERSVDQARNAWSDFAAAYEEVFPAVLWYTLYRVHNRQQAEDLTADIFERALRSWHTFEHRSSARQWILGIARHVIADYQRRKPAVLPLVDLSFLEFAGAASCASAEDEAQARDEARLLNSTVSQLTPAEQELVGLCYVAGLSFREIAQLLKVREGALRMRVHRINSQLRELLLEEEWR